MQMYNILIIHSLNFVQDDVVLQSADVETSRSSDGDITSISEAEDILQHGIMGDIYIGNLQRELLERGRRRRRRMCCKSTEKAIQRREKEEGRTDVTVAR